MGIITIIRCNNNPKQKTPSFSLLNLCYPYDFYSWASSDPHCQTRFRFRFWSSPAQLWSFWVWDVSGIPEMPLNVAPKVILLLIFNLVCLFVCFYWFTGFEISNDFDSIKMWMFMVLWWLIHSRLNFTFNFLGKSGGFRFARIRVLEIRVLGVFFRL